MPFIILVIGAVLVVVAYNNTHGDLASALQKDIPGYMRWAIAIVAIVALGWIPGFKSPSRWLLGLVALVIVVTQYKPILAGIQQFTGTAAASTGAGPQSPDPTTTGATGAQTTGALTGSAPMVANNAPPKPPNPFDPATYVGSYLAPTSGFGGAA